MTSDETNDSRQGIQQANNDRVLRSRKPSLHPMPTDNDMGWQLRGLFCLPAVQADGQARSAMMGFAPVQ